MFFRRNILFRFPFVVSLWAGELQQIFANWSVHSWTHAEQDHTCRAQVTLTKTLTPSIFRYRISIHLIAFCHPPEINVPSTCSVPRASWSILMHLDASCFHREFVNVRRWLILVALSRPEASLYVFLKLIVRLMQSRFSRLCWCSRSLGSWGLFLFF